MPGLLYMILRLYLEAEIVTRAILAALLLKIFPGEHAPGPPPGEFQNKFDKGPMLHSDPGPTNSLRGPGHRIKSFKDHPFRLHGSGSQQVRSPSRSVPLHSSNRRWTQKQ